MTHSAFPQNELASALRSHLQVPIKHVLGPPTEKTTVIHPTVSGVPLGVVLRREAQLRHRVLDIPVGPRIG